MPTGFETGILIETANQIALSHVADSPVAKVLTNWLIDTGLTSRLSAQGVQYGRTGVTGATWRRVRRALNKAERETGDQQPDLAQNNAMKLALHLDIDDVGRYIFAFSLRTALSPELASLVGKLGADARMPLERLLGCILEYPTGQILEALDHKSSLMQSGLVTLEEAGFPGGYFPAVPGILAHAIRISLGGLPHVLKNLFSEHRGTRLDWTDFEHLGDTADLASRLLAGAVEQKTRGVNILVTGPAGCGKTEFCKTLAEHVDARLYHVPRSGFGFGQITSQERIECLRLDQRVVAREKPALMLFDDIEDLPSAGEAAQAFADQMVMWSQVKMSLNGLLESNPVPTLWTCGDPDIYPQSFLSRFSLVVEMYEPGERARIRMWKKLAGLNELSLDDATCAELARSHPVPPALADNALRVAAMAGGGVREVRLTLRSLGRAMRLDGDNARCAAHDLPTFSLDLINTDVDLQRLTKRLTSGQVSQGVSFCLSGPPGSGKSACARYLAEKMGLPVIQKRASDLLSKWVGSSERNIAAAFEEARRQNAFLIFDEADSFLAPREQAGRSWEVTQVNEMLTWMESHPLPFACTTNLSERMDSAALRRFTFKVEFRPLTPAQLDDAFIRFFEQAPPDDLPQLDNLTPGDLAVVRRRADVLGITDRSELFHELEREMAAKQGKELRIGFRRPGGR